MYVYGIYIKDIEPNHLEDSDAFFKFCELQSPENSSFPISLLQLRRTAELVPRKMCCCICWTLLGHQCAFELETSTRRTIAGGGPSFRGEWPFKTAGLGFTRGWHNNWLDKGMSMKKIIGFHLISSGCFFPKRFFCLSQKPVNISQIEQRVFFWNFSIWIWIINAWLSVFWVNLYTWWSDCKMYFRSWISDRLKGIQSQYEVKMISALESATLSW